MASFKVVISDPKTKKSYQKEVDQAQSHLLGKKIDDKVKGDGLGLAGYELQITGGSDKEGFPMRKDVDGPGRKRILVTSGTGFHAKRKGERRRKSIRGNTISNFIVQVNTVVVAHGSQPLEKLVGKSEKAAEEENKKE
jgi:small subunit ribosomal protein S6e